jgi:hypothetical protein
MDAQYPFLCGATARATAMTVWSRAEDFLNDLLRPG